MDDKNHITVAENAQKDIISDDCRYTYLGRTVLVDGAGYPIISAISIVSSGLQIDYAEDKIIQLITGKKFNSFSTGHLNRVVYFIDVSYSV